MKKNLVVACAAFLLATVGGVMVEHTGTVNAAGNDLSNLYADVDAINQAINKTTGVTVNVTDRTSGKIVGTIVLNKANQTIYGRDVQSVVPKGYALPADIEIGTADAGTTLAVPAEPAQTINVIFRDVMTGQVVQKATQVNVPKVGTVRQWASDGYFSLPENYHVDRVLYKTSTWLDKELPAGQKDAELLVTNQEKHFVELVDADSGTIVKSGSYTTKWQIDFPAGWFATEETYRGYGYQVVNNRVQIKVNRERTAKQVIVKFVTQDGVEIATRELYTDSRGKLNVRESLPTDCELIGDGEISMQDIESGKTDVRVKMTGVPVKVRIVDNSTNSVLKEATVTTFGGYAKRADIQALLPAGYVVNSLSEQFSLSPERVNTIDVSAGVKVNVAFRDTATGETIKSKSDVVATSLKLGDVVDDWMPTDYRIDKTVTPYFWGYDISRENNSFTIAVTRKDTTKIQYVDADSLVTFESHEYMNSSEISVPKGYELTTRNLDRDFAVVDGVVQLKVQKVLSGISVNVTYKTADGKVVGTEDLMTDYEGNLYGIHAPYGYEFVSDQPATRAELLAGKLVRAVIASEDKNAVDSTITYIDRHGNVVATVKTKASVDSAYRLAHEKVPAGYQVSDVNEDDLANITVNVVLDTESTNPEINGLRDQVADLNAKYADLLTRLDAMAGAQSRPQPQPQVVVPTQPVVSDSVTRQLQADNQRLQAQLNVLQQQVALLLQVKQPTQKPVAKPAATGVVRIKYVPGYGVQLWQKDGRTAAKNAQGAKRKLAHGSRWRVFGTVKIGKKTYYNLGGMQLVDAAYAQVVK